MVHSNSVLFIFGTFFIVIYGQVIIDDILGDSICSKNLYCVGEASGTNPNDCFDRWPNLCPVSSMIHGNLNGKVTVN